MTATVDRHDESTTRFRSILFGATAVGAALDDRAEPACFRDLNIDQIVAGITEGKQEYHLEPFLFSPLEEIDAIEYRQQVFADLEHQGVYEAVARFAQRMRSVRADLELARKFHYYAHQQQRWILNAVEVYCEAVSSLASDLATMQLESHGMLGLCAYLDAYVDSARFTAMRDETSRLVGELDAVRYCLLIKGNRITVGPYDGEDDYSERVEKTFERFQQGAVTTYRSKFHDTVDMDHIEAGVLDLVAQVYPVLFGELSACCSQYGSFRDDTITAFDREVQFYLSYLGYIQPLRDAGLVLSYPRLSVSRKQEQVSGTFDLALAAQLVREHRTVVCNDYQLTGPERILVVSGPNNGGKTTLARTFGQLHYLARLGCPIPGREIALFCCDEIYTHFEKEEDIATLAGKLAEELNRLRDDFTGATPNNIMIMNEMFSSTTAHDALFLSREILGRLSELDALGVCVTFLDQLATLNDKTVSMVSTVVPDDPATRTYKLIRKPADGRAYALAIAQKHGLTAELLEGRVNR